MSGKSLAQIARELGVTTETLQQWLKQVDLALRKRSDGLTSDGQEEPQWLQRENRMLREEREILKESCGLLRAGDRLDPLVGYEFIERERANHAIVTLCRVLDVSPSGSWAWRKREPSARARADAQFTGGGAPARYLRTVRRLIPSVRAISATGTPWWLMSWFLCTIRLLSIRASRGISSPFHERSPQRGIGNFYPGVPGNYGPGVYTSCSIFLRESARSITRRLQLPPTCPRILQICYKNLDSVVTSTRDTGTPAAVSL